MSRWQTCACDAIGTQFIDGVTCSKCYHARASEAATIAADNGARAGGTMFLPAGVLKSLRRDEGLPPDAQLEAVPDGQLLMIKNGEATIATEEDLV